MSSKMISVPALSGGQFDAYLALPPTGKGPGLVLIQEIFGVNTHIRAVADQYAMDGYVVLAPDVFWRQAPGIQLGYDQSGFEKGLGLLNNLDFDLALDDLKATASALKSMPEVTGKVASIGYCMGGMLSYLLGTEPGAVDASVCYYGGGIHTALNRKDHATNPMLLHFAEKDGFIPQEAVAEVKAALGDKPNVNIHTYAGVDHGFNCWARGMYNQQAASLARGRTLAFLACAIA